MFRIFFFLFIFCGTFPVQGLSQVINSDVCGRSFEVTGYIAYGTRVKRGQFPWMVALLQRIKEESPMYICGGTLVAADKVVTAAHCIHPKYAASPTKARDLTVLLGAFDLDDQFEHGKTSVAPSEVVIHGDWHPHVDRYNDDIAVLLIETKIHFTNFIRPICLWTEDGDPGVVEGIVVGWGKSEISTGYTENKPAKLEIPIVETNGRCYQENNILAKIGSDNSFCAGRSGVGVCQGDSGSGFIVKHNEKFYFKGIVSSSLNDPSGCYTKDYAIYTDAVKYKNFIANPKETNTNDSAKDVVKETNTDDPAKDVVKETNTNTCGHMRSSSSLVIGGKLSTREQFPWVVSVSKKTKNGFQHQGTGTLVSSRHVVTTAYSVGFSFTDSFFYYPADDDEIRLYFGSTKFDSSEEVGSIFIDGVESISMYLEAKREFPSIFDIAVVTLKEPIAFSTFISPVCLWNFGTSIDGEIGETAYGVGYGKDATGTVTGVRKHVPMTINSVEYCKSFHGDSMKTASKSEYFCASGRVGKVVYEGDYPLYLKKDGKWYLRGLMNYWKLYNGIIAANKPVLYENTAKFTAWIEGQIDMK